MTLSREVRRVPLDFDWPLKTPWPGFLPPETRPCPAGCDAGLTAAGEWVEHFAHLILTLAEAPVRGELHPWLAAIRPPSGVGVPSPEIVELTAGLAGREPSGFGHDAIDRWKAAKRIVAAAGLPEGWGVCPECEGHAVHPDDRHLGDEWERTSPPEGQGYQLWETVSEGSPISPVFDTQERLAAWLTVNETVAGIHYSESEWAKIVEGSVGVLEVGTGALS